jgi:hypothetical protein
MRIQNLIKGEVIREKSVKSIIPGINHEMDQCWITFNNTDGTQVRVYMTNAEFKNLSRDTYELLNDVGF